MFPGAVELDQVETNMVLVDTAPMGLEPLEAIRRLGDEGVGATIVPPRVRLVTHLGISDADVAAALSAWRQIAVGS